MTLYQRNIKALEEVLNFLESAVKYAAESHTSSVDEVHTLEAARLHTFKALIALKESMK